MIMKALGTGRNLIMSRIRTKFEYSSPSALLLFLETNSDLADIEPPARRQLLQILLDIQKTGDRGILYCTRLASSQSESERAYIREEMSQQPKLQAILAQLDTGKGEDVEMAETEAPRKRNKTEPEVDSSGLVAGNRKQLDLEELIFAAGDHLMANKRCQLPDGSFRKQRKAF